MVVSRIRRNVHVTPGPFINKYLLSNLILLKYYLLHSFRYLWKRTGPQNHLFELIILTNRPVFLNYTQINSIISNQNEGINLLNGLIKYYNKHLHKYYLKLSKLENLKSYVARTVEGFREVRIPGRPLTMLSFNRISDR